MTSPPPSAEASRAVPTLRVGFVPGVTLTRWRRTWAERYPRLGLDVVEVEQADQRAALTDERVDMCFVRLPMETDRLHVVGLYEEVPVVVVPRDHPASLFETVTLADLAEEDVVEGFATDEALDLVAGGAGVVVVPHAVARAASRPDLVYRPVSDGTPTRIALAWLRENPHEMIQELVGIVRGRTANSTRGSRPEAGAPAATRPAAPTTPRRKPAASRGRRTPRPPRHR